LLTPFDFIRSISSDAFDFIPLTTRASILIAAWLLLALIVHRLKGPAA